MVFLPCPGVHEGLECGCSSGHFLQLWLWLWPLRLYGSLMFLRPRGHCNCLGCCVVQRGSRMCVLYQWWELLLVFGASGEMCDYVCSPVFVELVPASVCVGGSRVVWG